MTPNLFTGTRIEFHILQSFPATCLNRDDVNSPKTAIVGGVTRARVSSQCWKRQVRMSLHDFGVKLAMRTRTIADKIAKACVELGADQECAQDCAKKISDSLAKDKTLYFLTDTEIEKHAQYAQALNFDASSVKDKEVQKNAKKVRVKALDGLDIALFGRMVALAPELNVTAAASFSHAISTHEANTELEFFTALDDAEELIKSGHMGTLEFNSATYYRYVSLDLGQLYETLDGQGLELAVEAFTKALFIAMPAARQNTLSGACPWDYARILVRKGQRLQLSFEKPVRASNGYLKPSIEALDRGLAAQEHMFGSLYGKQADYCISADSELNIDGLVEKLKSVVEAAHV